MTKAAGCGASAAPLDEEEMAVLFRAVAEHGRDDGPLAECPLPFDGVAAPQPTPACTRSRRPAPSSDDSSEAEVSAVCSLSEWYCWPYCCAPCCVHHARKNIAL